MAGCRLRYKTREGKAIGQPFDWFLHTRPPVCHRRFCRRKFKVNQPLTVTSTAIGGVMHPVINARDLHARLEVNDHFSQWIERRIEKYDFRKDADYLFTILGTNKQGRPMGEYTITLRMAKELAMVENNDQGRAVRRWFIDLEERQLRELRAELVKSRPLWRRIHRYLGMGLSGVETAKLCGIGKEGLRKARREMEALGLIAPPPNLASARQAAAKVGFGQLSSTTAVVLA
jgi:phage anti-repressor protein